jgi:hypothetical protein
MGDINEWVAKHIIARQKNIQKNNEDPRKEGTLQQCGWHWGGKLATDVSDALGQFAIVIATTATHLELKVHKNENFLDSILNFVLFQF